MKFTIDGALTDSWSGDESWDRVSYPVSGGPHTFEWKYEKDSSDLAGEDTAWIDDVTVGPTP